MSQHTYGIDEELAPVITRDGKPYMLPTFVFAGSLIRPDTMERNATFMRAIPKLIEAARVIASLPLSSDTAGVRALREALKDIP